MTKVYAVWALPVGCDPEGLEWIVLTTDKAKEQAAIEWAKGNGFGAFRIQDEWIK